MGLGKKPTKTIGKGERYKYMHDSIIHSYNVNLLKKTLTLSVGNKKSEVTQQILMTGVLTHFFENVLEHNVILSIEEFSIEVFLQEKQHELELSKNYGWPVMYENVNELKQFLNDNEYIYIKIYSSWGLSGWVMAKSICYL